MWHGTTVFTTDNVPHVRGQARRPTATSLASSKRKLLFHPKTKAKQNELTWSVKRDELNKCIYKNQSKLLTCKPKLELECDQMSNSPKLILQLHPYGAEDDANEHVTVKVLIDLPKKCRLHSETEIELTIGAMEDDNSTGTWIGPLRKKCEPITKSFFYVKKFISHLKLKNTSCKHVQIIAYTNLALETSL